jgi:hypothetical protein
LALDLNRNIAERRIRRENRLPKRYRDVLPVPPASLPPPSQPPPDLTEIRTTTPPLAPQEQPPSSARQGSPSISDRVKKILKSARNSFGLFRQYYSSSFPQHDPDNLTSDELTDTTDPKLPPSSSAQYHPYPNQSSFLLGEWYWNDGAKKSQSSFKNLLNIVAHPDFQPEDVARTNWKRIDKQLGGDLLVNGSSSDGPEGVLEDLDATSGWHDTPIKIKVPFHRRTEHPGQKVFEVGRLRHRKLTSVIREKISRPSCHPHFHFEPYELYWQPNEGSDPVRVHGELYSSDEYLRAHHELQESPGEPGCDLPRVIVGLMFSSDGTQLTAFSNAKLWPVYLVFGNESKERRSKPSCHAFEHIAYFESVSAAALQL